MKIRLIFIIIVACFQVVVVPNQVSGQSINDSLQQVVLSDSMKNLVAAYDVSAVRQLLPTHEKLLVKNQDWESLYKTYIDIADCYISVRQLEEADNFLNKSDSILNRHEINNQKNINFSKVLRGLYVCFAIGFSDCVGDFEQLVPVFEKDKDTANLQQACSNLAGLYSYLSKPYESIAIYEKLLSTENPINANTLRALAIVHRNVGHFDQSQGYLHRAIALLENKTMKPLERLDLVGLYNQVIGEAIANKNYMLVESSVDRNKDLIKELPTEFGQHNTVIRTSELEAEYWAATFQEEKILNRLNQSKKVNHVSLCDQYESLSSMYYRLKLVDKMESYVTLAKSCYEANGVFKNSANKRSIFKRMEILLLSLQEKHDAAITLQNSVFDEAADINFMPTVVHVNRTAFGARHLQVKAMLAIEAFRQTGNKKYFNIADMTLLSLDSIYNQRMERQVFREPGLLFERCYSMASELSGLAYMDESNENNLQHFIDHVEKSKWIYSMNQNIEFAKKTNDECSQLLGYELQLWRVLKTEKDKLADSAQARYYPLITQRIDSISQELASLKNQLNEQAPDLYRQRYSTHPPTLKDLQRAIHPDEQLLVYSYYDDQLTVANIQRDTTWMRANTCLDLPDKVDRFYATLLQGRQYGEIDELMPCFLDGIIDPIKKKITVIWPGSISVFPLELLMPDEATDYNVRYLNACKDVINPVNVRRNDDHIVAFSFKPRYTVESSSPLLASRDINVDLPGATKELDEISLSFPSLTKLFYQANRADFMEHAENSNILHLALHSVANKNSPSFSYLQFSDSLSEAGRVYFHEIQKMQLNADLVCLSSCNSGVGKYLDGEGTASLSLAFQQAGCTNIVQSLWPVNDASTAQLMKYFYAELNNGKSKPQALALAKQQFKNNAPNKWRHPYYWAGFVYFGDRTSMVMTPSTNWINWCVGIGLVMILLLIIYKRTNE